jgi:ribosomal protein L11 methyltransferase
MSAGPRWSTHTAVLADGDLGELVEAFAGVGFAAYAVASRTDGRHDLTCWGADGALPAAVTALLAARRIDLRGGDVADEATLLAGFLPEDPVELAPGWWIDPCGRLPADHRGTVLRMPPSTAFGDGHHPSTRMAAGRLAGMDLRGQRLLDLGTGSGVLALVAALRGAAVAITDIDPSAVATADATLRAHGISNHKAATCDLLTGAPEGPYDVVVANIYADLLVDLLADPRLRDLHPAGTLILSGIAEARWPLVAAALGRAGYSVHEQACDAWWVCAVAVRETAALRPARRRTRIRRDAP